MTHIDHSTAAHRVVRRNRGQFAGQFADRHDSVWMDATYPRYDPDAAPAVLMKNDPSHNATRGVFWSSVSPGTPWRIAEEQFEAAGVPQSVAAEYSINSISISRRSREATEMTMDPSKVPRTAIQLLAMAERWGIGDDLYREAAVRAASIDDLEALAHCADGVDEKELYDWLCGPESANPTKEYLAITNLTMAMDAAKLRLSRMTGPS